MPELMQLDDQISSFKKLKLEEAQELYKKAISTIDETQKKAYMDELILGTLYVVYNYIKRNNLELFISPSYDINDIISSFSEIWIKKVYNGELLTVDRYSALFTSTYLNEVCNNLCGDEISVNGLFGFSTHYFVEFLITYIGLKNKSFATKFMNVIKEEYYDTGELPFYTYRYVGSMIPLFEDIYTSLNIDPNEKLTLNKRKIISYLKLIISKGLLGSLTTSIPDKNNMEDCVLGSMTLKHFIDDIALVLRDERMIQIIHERYGLNGEKSLGIKTVGQIHGISAERVRQIETKALRRLKWGNTIRKYTKEGF